MKDGVERLLAVSVALGALAVSAARIDVHPQCFDAGGWKLDVQFIDVIKLVIGLLMLRSDFWARNVVNDVSEQG